MTGRPPKTPGVHTLEAVGITTEAPDIAIAHATIRRDLSQQHIQASEYFGGLLAAHELAHGAEGWGDQFDKAAWLGSAAIILAFSAIEAAVDEAEDDIKLENRAAAAIERVQTLDRAQILLAFKGAPTFEPGAAPFQDANLLRELRNGLVHPKAEWDNDRRVNKRLSLRIVSARLPLSPFQSDPDLAFPHGCMSAGVAEWSARSARAFVSELRQRLGLTKKL